MYINPDSAKASKPQARQKHWKVSIQFCIAMHIDFWYETAVALVLAIHLAWILWVILGSWFTRGRPAWTIFHIGSLIWGIVVELGPWPCPLTITEGFLQHAAGFEFYRGSFVVHYLERIVYPNLPAQPLIWGGVAVCIANLAVYLWRWRQWQARPSRIPGK